MIVWPQLWKFQPGMSQAYNNYDNITYHFTPLCMYAGYTFSLLGRVYNFNTKNWKGHVDFAAMKQSW